MPWIESHTTLARHPKTLRFARGIGVSVPTAIGHLHLLWWWAIEYAPSGDLSGFDAEEVALACQWERPADVLWTSLQRAGFVDADGVLHDWQEYAGKLIDRRKQDADRKREARKQGASPAPSHLNGTPADAVRRTSGGRRTDGVRTVPNPTVSRGKESLTTAVEGGPGREASASAQPPLLAPVPKPSRSGKPAARVGAMIDALRSEGMTGSLTSKDRQAIASTDCDPAQVAALYAAVFHGEYGDDFMLKKLSVASCIDNLPGWQAHQLGNRAPPRPTTERRSRSREVAAAIDDFGKVLDDAGFSGRPHQSLPPPRSQLRGLPS